MLGAQAQQQTGQELAAQQAIPDAPSPQTTLPKAGSIAPGKGASSTSNGDTAPANSTGGSAVMPPAPSQSAPAAPDTADPEAAVPNESIKAFTLVVSTNFVEVPFTVRDSKGNLVAGLTARDVRVYENGLLQHITNFTPDPFPLSVALVIDQSLSHDNMTRVNDALGALQGAFAPYDEIAVFTYNNGPRMVTDFTGAQSARLVQAVETSKGTGRDSMLAGSFGGPLATTTVINDQNFDPNTSANRGHTSLTPIIPKEVHTLNDAILAAATSLSHAKQGRRRVVYVISDGKEEGSRAKTKDVIKYLQTNRIGVYGTLVGDSSLPVVGFLEGVHLPLTMHDNILPQYANATGGHFDPEFRTGAIEKSFARIAEEVRTQYTLGYYTHEPFIDGKYRKLEVRVLRPNLQVIAKQGYYPSAMESETVRSHVVSAPQ
jgi:VWFA-related protein